MTVVMNGEPRALPDGATLAEAVKQLTATTQGVAVAVNGAVVPRGQWPVTMLAEAEQVEVLTAVQGG
jgi:sulfur carrier protein